MDEGSWLRKRSVLVSRHATSVSLEQDFWDALKAIAGSEGRSINDLVSEIDGGRSGSLSSAIRLFVLRWLMRGGQAGQAGRPGRGWPPG